ncbi:hypothetical protein MNBD_GAMMA09-803 [hydrothermal vent metagenome]|uniref:Uncharacterized protein n=1 Tax=hydrothermal vent metagenome TaxID=652676 RepID=A0A3B0XJP4_9ZZZZ
MYFKHTQLIIFFCTGILSAPVFSEITELIDSSQEDNKDNFWLLENYQPPLNRVWLYGGIDEKKGGYYGLSTNLAINSSFYFDLSATQQNYDFKTNDLSWGFSGRLNEHFNWAVSRIFWGEKNSLEKTDTRMSITFFLDDFSSRLSYERGEVELFFEQQNILPINSLSSDHRSTEFSLSYNWATIYSDIKHKQHNYKTNQPERISRPVIFALANSIALQQARNLAERESSILLGLQLHDINYELLFSQIDSAFSRNSYSYASFSLLKSIDPQLLLGASIDIPLNEGLVTAGLSLGYMW